MSATAASSKATPSARRISAKRAAIVAEGKSLRLNCRQRDSTVTGIFCASVVASTNFTCSGGSSRVFSIELKAARDNMCTSSMRYTL